MTCRNPCCCVCVTKHAPGCVFVCTKDVCERITNVRSSPLVVACRSFVVFVAVESGQTLQGGIATLD